MRGSMSPNAAIATAGVSSVVAYAYLAYISRLDSHPSLAIFYACLAITTAGWLYVLRRVAPVGWVVFFAVIFRFIGFFGAPPYEDDFFRYMWDGYVFATKGSPYGVTPSQAFGSSDLSPRMEEVLGGVNFPDIPTIYGPVSEVSFLLAWFMAPGELWPLKLLYLLIDGALCASIWSYRRNSCDLLLYGWCPLVIKEVAFTAHTDVIAAALLFIAWLLLGRRRFVTAGAVLGLAIAAKIVVLAVAPILLWKGKPRVYLTTAAVAALCYMPFLAQGATDFDGLRVFSREWEFNSFGYAIAKVGFGASAARGVALAAYVAFCGYVCFRKPEWLRPDILLGAFLIVSPVVNPWYLVLIAPFIAVHPSAVGIAALAAILLSYVTEGNLRTAAGQFEHPVWVRIVQASIVGTAAAWQILRRSRRFSGRRMEDPPAECSSR